MAANPIFRTIIPIHGESQFSTQLSIHKLEIIVFDSLSASTSSPSDDFFYSDLTNPLFGMVWEFGVDSVLTGNTSISIARPDPTGNPAYFEIYDAQADSHNRAVVFVFGD